MLVGGMSYLYIEIVIGGLVLSMIVTEDYIIQYDSIISNDKPARLINRNSDEAYRLSPETRLYVKEIAPRTFSQGWTAEGTKRKVLGHEFTTSESFGEVLVVTIEKTRLIRGEKLKFNHIHKYISREHPLILKYCLIDDEIDWRISNNNKLLLREDFPFALEYSGVTNSKEIDSSYKVVVFEEREFTIGTYERFKEMVIYVQ